MRSVAVRLVLALVLLSSAEMFPKLYSQEPRIVPGRVLVGGEPYFLAGVNYPWNSGQEFGSGGWGYAGVATPTTNAEIDTDFANMAARGVRVVKWRIFNDGRYDPKRDARGYVTGVDPQLLADLAAAVRLAEKHDLYLIFTLFGSGFWTTDCSDGQVRFGGGAQTLVDPAYRRSLVNNGIIPVLRAVGRNPRVLAFEVIAEPEWGVPGLNLGDQDKGLIQVPLAPLQAFVREAASAVHEYSRAMATVESNRASHMALWRGLGLDYYSFSWYDWMEPWEPLDRPASSFGLDRPIVLGEFPASGSKYYSLPQVFDLALRQGYAGAFAWSYWGGDGHRWRDVEQDHLDWVRAHWPLVSLRAGAPLPSAIAQTIPPPYAHGDPRLTPIGNDLRVDLDVQVRQEGSYQFQVVLQTLNPPGAWQQERTQTASLAASALRRLSVRFNGIEEGKVYKLSVAIFDSNWQLLKWFDQVSLVEVHQGAVVMPDLVTENPCQSREVASATP